MDDQKVPREPGVIRIFVSSTFRDMQAERDELAKFIFPKLRKDCEERGVTWGEVDLRWGITNEQKTEGKVLPICMDEIKRCRPFFISILGERYGWIPNIDLDPISPELFEREPWLKEHLEKSVTELEILHGVLNNPEMANHAFFYFRDPESINALPLTEQTIFYEQVQPDEIEAFGEEEATRRLEARRKKLDDLKGRIRRSGFPLREGYKSPQQLGEWVLQDLLKVIDSLYPASFLLDPLDREAAEHEAFARSRRRVYIDRPSYFEQLDAHARTGGQPLVVLGESGGGKSALLATWAFHYQEEHPEALVLTHFIGASSSSTDWAAMLRRLMGELKRRFNIQDEIPDNPEALRRSFPQWLHIVSGSRKTVLVIDALNQLEDRDGALDLTWLPPVMPSRISMVLSTLPGRPLEEINKRKLAILSVEPLEPEERKRLIREYLALYTKALSSANIEHISSAEQTKNPLFLRALLDELRLFGLHEKLGERIEVYLQASDIRALYDQILERCEQDYERERSGLVRDSMSLLWAARRGLSEAELMDLLGTNGLSLPHAYWSPFFLALESSFLNRGGRIAFFHEYLSRAVCQRFLPDKASQKNAHLKLADYFYARESGPRQMDELAWQLAQAKAWQRLYNLLTDIQYLSKAWHHNQFDIRAYWTQIESESSLRMVDGYADVIHAPQYYDHNLINPIYQLLGVMGHRSEAMILGNYLIEHSRLAGETSFLSASLGNQGLLLRSTGDLEGAISLFKQQERLCRDLGDTFVLQHSLGNQATIHYDRHELIGALALYQEQETICRERGYKSFLAHSLTNQGSIFLFRGDLKSSMSLYQEAERLYKELGDMDGLTGTLGNQAAILADWGDLEGALKLHIEQERIHRELGNLEGLQIALGGQADIAKARGNLKRALELFDLQEQICRQIEYWDGVQKSTGSQAGIYQIQRDLDKALMLYREQEAICRQYGLTHRLPSVYLNQALVHHLQSDPGSAQSMLDRARSATLECGDRFLLGVWLGSVASFKVEQRDFDGALTYYKEQEAICRELGDQHNLQYCLGQQAGVNNRLGEFITSIQLLLEREQLCRELNHLDGLQATLGSLGVMLKDGGKNLEAMYYLSEQERICREIGNRDGLQRALGDMANILFSQGKLAESLQLHAEEEEICRQMNNLDGLQGALGNKAVVLSSLGQVEEAMALYKEKERICRQIGQANGLVTALANQAIIHVNCFGDLEKARQLVREGLATADNDGLVGKAQQMRQLLAQLGG